MMNKKQENKELVNYQFVKSDLFDHLFSYASQIVEIAESLQLELDDLQKQASAFETWFKESYKKRKQNE